MIFIKILKKNNPGRERKILIVFDDMIADMLSNKKLNPIVNALFIRGSKLIIPLVFIKQSYFKKYQTKFYTLFFFFLKTPNKQELYHSAFDHLLDIGLKDFMDL